MIEFTHDNKKYVLKDPTAEQLSEADFRYAAMYSKCLKNGILTQDAMLELLIKDKLISEDMATKQVELQQSISDLEEKLNKTNSKEKKIKIAKEMLALRRELFDIISSVNNYMFTTAESLADDARIKYIVFATLVDEDGNPVFTNYDEFVNQKEGVAITAISKYLLHRSGIPEGFSTPEEKALKELGVMNEEGLLLNKDGKYVDTLGRLIDKRSRFVDEEGYLINIDGKYVNENGEVVSPDQKVKGDF